MLVTLMVRQDPSVGLGSLYVGQTRVNALKQGEVCDIHVELPIGSHERFEAALDHFIATKMPSCRRDGMVVLTAYAMSWDPVQKLKDFTAHWARLPETA